MERLGRIPFKGSVIFDPNCKLSLLESSAFFSSGLTSIHIPASVEVICENCFESCHLLVSVTFEQDCKLSRLESSAFFSSGLISIHIPVSVEVICRSCFQNCHSLVSVTFDQNCKLRVRDSDLLAGKCLSSRHGCACC
jgi:hypothetical protein